MHATRAGHARALGRREAPGVGAPARRRCPARRARERPARGRASGQEEQRTLDVGADPRGHIQDRMQTTACCSTRTRLHGQTPGIAAPARARVPGATRSMAPSRRPRSRGRGLRACHGPRSGSRARRAGLEELTNREKSGTASYQRGSRRAVDELRSLHVGDADREVSHDHIAAGHPRLAFESVAYTSPLPQALGRAVAGTAGCLGCRAGGDAPRRNRVAHRGPTARERPPERCVAEFAG